MLKQLVVCALTVIINFFLKKITKTLGFFCDIRFLSCFSFVAKHCLNLVNAYERLFISLL